MTETPATPANNWYVEPERKTEFIAYHKDTVDTPDENGQPIRFRAQTLVREFPSVLVKDHKTSTVPGHSGSPDLVTSNFTFDAASLGIPGFTNDFSASLRADDPAHQTLVWAQQNNAPVLLVVETARKARDDKGQPIDPHTTIHELRGATADGKQGNPQLTRKHCKNVIVAVAQPGNMASLRVTSEAVSDPTEWVGLRNNSDGRYAPAGYRPGDGGIVSVTPGTPQAGGATLGEDAVAAIVAQVADLIRPLVTDKANGRPPQRDTIALEEQPWKPWNSDGRLNAGSWAMSKYRAHFEWALGKMNQVGIIDDVLDAAEKLTLRVLWMIDRVHGAVVQTTGNPRLTKSHGEASRWVLFVIDKVSMSGEAYKPLIFTPEVMTDEAVRNAWSSAVIEQATTLFHANYANVAKNLDPNWVEPRADNAGPVAARPQGHQSSAASPASPAPAPQQQVQQQPAPAQPAPPVQQHVPAQPAPTPAPVQMQAPAPQAPAPQAPAASPASPTIPADDPWNDVPDPYTGHNADQVPDLVTRYTALLHRVGAHAAANPSRFYPHLRATLGGDGTLSTIPADAFAEALPTWENDPGAFEAAAKATYMTARNQGTN